MSDQAAEILDGAIAEHDPRDLYALFSGGGDSLAATLVASRHERFGGCVFIDTGTAAEGTVRFVRETCERQGWPLRVYRPPIDYTTLVLTKTAPYAWDGFPGPGFHNVVYRRLKERCIEQLIRDVKPAGRFARVGLVTGIRAQESKRRMPLLRKGPVGRRGAQVYVAPLLDWATGDVRALLDASGLPRNETASLLGRSGECNCGAFAADLERELLFNSCPDVAEQMTRLEWEAHRRDLWSKRWGRRPPGRPIEGQMELSGWSGLLCASCTGVA